MDKFSKTKSGFNRNRNHYNKYRQGHTAGKNKVIGFLKMTDYRKISFTVTEYEGENRVDIRENLDVNLDLDNPQWLMTKKGVQIRSEYFEEFFKLVRKLKKYLIKHGMFEV